MTRLANFRFLLTGAHGFIGAWITKRLLEAHADVVIFDRNPDPQHLRLIMPPEQAAEAEVVIGDVTEAAAVSAVIEKHEITNLIHLAGLQLPACRSQPATGALVNVVGTINVFEAVRNCRAVRRVVYASSAAVFGVMEGDQPVGEADEPQPSSHYGVFKRCNEGNARVYFLEHGISSIGLRPLTVYGVGRDTGVTSDPTKAMKAAVINRSFHIRFGGKTDFQYVADTADIFIRAAVSDLDGAHLFNLHGETVDVSDVVREIESVLPAIRGSITYADEPLAIPAAMNDSAIRNALGPVPSTPLAAGVRATIERFQELQQEGRLDTSDLEQ